MGRHPGRDAGWRRVKQMHGLFYQRAGAIRFHLVFWLALRSLLVLFAHASGCRIRAVICFYEVKPVTARHH